MENLNVYWNFRGQKQTGIISFEELENGNIWVSWSSNESTQVIENGELSKDEAQEVYDDILEFNYNLTNYVIFN